MTTDSLKMLNQMRLFLEIRTADLPGKTLVRFPGMGSHGRAYLRQELNAAMDIIYARCLRSLAEREREMRRRRQKAKASVNRKHPW